MKRQKTFTIHINSIQYKRVSITLTCPRSSGTIVHAIYELNYIIYFQGFHQCT